MERNIEEMETRYILVYTVVPLSRGGPICRNPYASCLEAEEKANTILDPQPYQAAMVACPQHVEFFVSIAPPEGSV